MFSKLKNLATRSRGASSTAAVIDILCPGLLPHLARVSSFSATELLSDRDFTDKVIKPAHADLDFPGNRTLRTFDDFERRFTIALLYTRDELCLVDADTDRVHLALNAMERLPQVLHEGFQLSALSSAQH